MTKQWCYYQNIETSHGMYASREEAIEAGRADYGNEAFTIALCCAPDIDACVRLTVDVGSILEQMDEVASRGTFFDDACFEVGDRKEAEAALQDALAAWAEKHVSSNFQWITTGEGEELIEPEGES